MPAGSVVAARFVPRDTKPQSPRVEHTCRSDVHGVVMHQVRCTPIET
jgi:hypothetical protein